MAKQDSELVPTPEEIKELKKQLYLCPDLVKKGVLEAVAKVQLTKADLQGAYNKGFEQAKREERERILGDKLSMHVADKEQLVDVGEWAECQDVGVFVYFPYGTYQQALRGEE